MITLKIGTVIDSESQEISDSVSKEAISQSRWRPGYATINSKQIAVEKLIYLGEFEYRIGENILDNNCIEAWLPSEYMQWRDD